MKFLMEKIVPIICYVYFLNLNFSYGRLNDDECYQYYSEFGIHVNNFKIEDCVEVNVMGVPTKPEFAFLIAVNDKVNNSVIMPQIIMHKTNNTLIEKNTLVAIMWTTIYRNETSNIGNFSSVEKFAPDVSNFTMYQNHDMNAAMVLFSYGSICIVEGVIGDYILRFVEREVKYVWIKVSYPYERIPIDWTSMTTPKTNETQLNYNLNGTSNSVNVSLAVILDDLSVELKSPEQVLKSVIIYYNAVDMLYSHFTSPKINLVIQILMIPASIYKVTYYEHRPLNFLDIHSNDDKRSPMVVLDMVILPLCDVTNSSNCISHGRALYPGLYCGDYTTNNTDNKTNIGYQNTPIYQVRHMDFHGGFVKAAQQIALTFNASLLNYDSMCSGIMNSYTDPPYLPFNWSSCTIEQFSAYFRSTDESCFKFRRMLL